MSGTVVQDAVAALRTAYDALAACDIDLLTATELLDVGDELETLDRQLPTQSHRLLARLQVETTARELGAKSWKDVLATRWRISTAEAGRRLTDASLLGPRRSLIGESLPPVLEATAAAAAHGLITAEHVEIIRKAIAKIPGYVDTATRTQIEIDWARLAVKVGPKELLDGVDLRLFLLDQDGPEPDDTERARKRGIAIGKQGRDSTSQVTGWLTPEARATWEPIFAKYAAPGMCNPDDPEPCTCGTPTQAQIDNDHRSLAQRQHDAFIAVGRIALMCGELGQLNGLPVSIIIRTTLQDLESRAGIGVTGGGTKMSAKDVLRLAGHANLFLAVFDKATGSAMDLFRARRVASLAQRIMLIGRDGGCTKPSCTVGPYGTQVHHAAADWADDGNTNVDEMGLACGPDNRMVDKKGGWTTRLNERHEVEWIPPPHLDTGQARVNYYHTPERLLTPDDDPEPQADNNIGNNTGASAQPEPEPDEDSVPETLDPWAQTSGPVDSAAPEATVDDDCDPAEPFDPWGPDTPSEADCPAPADVDDTVDLVSPEAEQDSAPEPFDPWAPDTPIDSGQSAPPDDYTAQCRSPEPQPDEPPTSEPIDPSVPDYNAELATPHPNRDQPAAPEPFGPVEIDTPAESDETAPADDDTVDPASAEPVPNHSGAAEQSWSLAEDTTEPGGPAPPDNEVA
jgi:hypothetical protein